MNVHIDIKHIIFDWNGTLVNDLALAVAGVNKVREHQALPPIDRDLYREHFAFPIRNFYAKLDIDFEKLSFSRLSEIYLGMFNEGIKSCALHDGAIEVMTWARENGIKISVLSASHRDTLQSNLEHLGLIDCVDHVFGLQNSEASGKLELAQELDALLGAPGNTALLVGDTDHDIEVGRACGWRISCVSHGHQSAQRLAQADVEPFADLRSVFGHYFPKSHFA